MYQYTTKKFPANWYQQFFFIHTVKRIERPEYASALFLASDVADVHIPAPHRYVPHQ